MCGDGVPLNAGPKKYKRVSAFTFTFKFKLGGI